MALWLWRFERAADNVWPTVQARVGPPQTKTNTKVHIVCAIYVRTHVFTYVRARAAPEGAVQRPRV